ncbi:hypothetical protein CYMTET_30785, partial [Cymbomonas tetramitiformis]
VMFMMERKPRGWFARTVMWNLVLLQHSDGSYDICPGVATVLHAGDTSEFLDSEANYELEVDMLARSMPATMRLDSTIPTELKDKIWATICCLERYKLLPFGWVVNPQELPSERRTLEEISLMFLERQKAQYPVLEMEMEDLVEDAKAVVKQWNDERVEAISKLRAKVKKDKDIARDGMSEKEKSAEWRQGWRNELWMMVCSHPFLAIWAVKATEPFTRAQRILVLARDDEALPEFLNAEGYTCQEFPNENAIMDQVYKAVIVVGISLPVNICLSMLFTIGGTPVVLKFWQEKKKGKGLKVLGTDRHARVENALYFLFTVILDFSWLARALARYFLMLADLIDNTYDHLKEVWTKVKSKVDKTTNTLWFMLHVLVYKRDAAVVLQEMEVRKMKKEQEEAVRLTQRTTVTLARAELDSLFVQVCYVLLTLTWALVIWFQLVYAIQLRSLEGPAAEQLVIKGWVLALILDNLGVAVFKSILMKSAIRHGMLFLQGRAKGELGITGWYENYVTRYLTTQYSANGEEMDDGVSATNDVLYGVPGLF